MEFQNPTRVSLGEELSAHAAQRDQSGQSGRRSRNIWTSPDLPNPVCSQCQTIMSRIAEPCRPATRHAAFQSPLRIS